MYLIKENTQKLTHTNFFHKLFFYFCLFKQTSVSFNNIPPPNITKRFRSPSGETVLVDLRHDNFVNSRKNSSQNNNTPTLNSSRRNSGQITNSSVSVKRRLSTTNNSYRQIPAESLETLKFLDKLQNYNKNYNDFQQQVYYNKMPGGKSSAENGGSVRNSELIPVCDPPPDFVDNPKDNVKNNNDLVVEVLKT